MREAVIITGYRTPVGKAKRGTTRTVRPEEMGAAVIQKVMADVAGKVAPEDIDDVIIGCAMPEGSQGLNMARHVVLKSGLPADVPAVTVNRFCSSGLQTIAQAANSIIAGNADIILAGGIETMSGVPMTGFRIEPDPGIVEMGGEAYMGMGLTAENVADEWNVTRADQDAFAAESHRRAAAAISAGKFDKQLVPIVFEEVTAGENGQQNRREVTLDRDEHLRPGTTAEGLGRLRPVFRQGGSVTAGNSSPLSDGAAMVLIMERSKAEELGLTPKLKYVTYSVAGVPPEIMGIGPIKSVPKALKRAGLEMGDIDLIELNEAFAAQSLAVIRTLDIDMEKVNVNGGAIALGHPLGCTGAKLTVQLMHEMEDRDDAKYGMVTMCIGGGQGATGIFEKI